MVRSFAKIQYVNWFTQSLAQTRDHYNATCEISNATRCDSAKAARHGATKATRRNAA